MNLLKDILCSLFWEKDKNSFIEDAGWLGNAVYTGYFRKLISQIFRNAGIIKNPI